MSKSADQMFSLGREIKIPALGETGAGDFQCASCGVPWDNHNGVQAVCAELLTFKVLAQSLADSQVKLVDEHKEQVAGFLRVCAEWKALAESWEDLYRRAQA
jgi:hypothetical protein